MRLRLGGIMPRPAVEIKPIRAKRLKTLCNEQNITQARLATEINLSPQTISKIVNGRCSLTEQNAMLIISKYPTYRFEWLMGYDDFKTEIERKAAETNRFLEHGNALDSGITSLAHCCGCEIYTPDCGDDDIPDEEIAKMPVRLIMGNKSVCLTMGQYADLVVYDIADYTQFRLKQLFRRKGHPYNG
jgi:transcriptional regulator with XRE-family HTH domain